MFKGRRGPLVDPVTVTLDGAEVTAERGEPLALALIAADKTIVARSPKLHRPRGPACFRGGCDGCLARVDGAPNVMTCLVPARAGARIESQNVVGSRKADLLRVTDWFFPKGIDHHHLMAGVPALGEAMQSFAQKVAGLGRVPAAVQPVAAGERLDVDVAVVGGGVAGIVAASRISRTGLRVVLIDDGLEPGGALLGCPAALRELLAREPLDRANVLSRHVAAGAFPVEGAPADARRGRDDALGITLLVASDARATLVATRAILFATGAHDAAIAAGGNDLPGVFSARALCRILACGVVPDGPIGVVRAEGAGYWADQLASQAGGQAVVVDAADLERFVGTGGVSGLGLASGARRKVAVVGVDGAGAPAFELLEQAGAQIEHRRAGYRPVLDEAGRAAPGVWATGECAGAPFDPGSIAAAAARVAAHVIEQVSPR